MSNLRDWLDMNGRMNTNHLAGKPPWKVIFPFAIWNIWKNRNGVVFNRKNRNPNLASVVLKQVMEFVFCVETPRGLTRHVIKRVRWEKPPYGWVKLNTDGAAEGNQGWLVVGVCLGMITVIGLLVLRGELGQVPVLWWSYGALEMVFLCAIISTYLHSLLSLMPKQLLIFCRTQTMRISYSLLSWMIAGS